MNVKAKASGQDCNGEKLPMRNCELVVRYTWDGRSGQYQPSTDALQRLEEENLKHPGWRGGGSRVA